MTNNKKGISLIVLIITIIVIIILAGAVILSLNNTNVISNANEAQKQQTLDSLNSKLQLILADEMAQTQQFVTASTASAKATKVLLTIAEPINVVESKIAGWTKVGGGTSYTKEIDISEFGVANITIESGKVTEYTK